MMQQQQYSQGQYNRHGYNVGYNMPHNGAIYPPQQGPTHYGQGYPSPNYSPQAYHYPQYPADPSGMMYNGVPQGFVGSPYQQGRARGYFYPPPGGRGGFNAGFRVGFRGGRGSFRGRKKKPFVGGSLETQRAWERETLCCFFMQDSCKFGDVCRFVHEVSNDRQCQFGEKCRVHGAKQKADREAVTETDGMQSKEGCAEAEGVTTEAARKEE